MNGPHGLYLISFPPFTLGELPLRPPFEVVETIRDNSMDEGIRTVYFNVVDKERENRTRAILANAFCDFVEFDYETRDAAAQWLLDYCNVKYGDMT